MSLESLLGEMADLERIARWPDPPYRCLQASSHDRASKVPGEPEWFANADQGQFLRTEERDGRVEQVMLDTEGPGALVRFWLTASGEKAGTLRVYLDGAKDPAIEFDGFDVTGGDLGVGPPLVQPHPGWSKTGGGANLWLPIPYAHGCKVTWEERGSGARYYQINHRAYPPGTAVRTFSREQLAAARDLVARTARALNAPSLVVPGEVVARSVMLAAGGGVTLDLPAGPRAVRGLELLLDPGDTPEAERALRGVEIVAEFDGEETIRCPATDFFGSCIGINPLASRYRSVGRDGTMRCRWPMPYARHARVTLRNTGVAPVAAALQATVAPWDWDDRSMHFHAGWHREEGLATPPPRDWTVARIAGRGVWAGDTLAIFNPVATWYGEGDEKITVDGEPFPSHFGTGTEDYYGYSFAPQGLIDTPFGGQARIDHPSTQGWNVMSRERLLDAIPFESSFDFSFELIAWHPTDPTYAATACWYAFPGATSGPVATPGDAALPVLSLADARARSNWRKAGAVECEGLTVLGASGDFRIFAQDMSLWDRRRFSAGEHLTVMARGPGDFVELEIPAPDDAPRRLLLDVTKAPDFGRLAFAVDGVASGGGFDAWGPEVAPGGTVDLGTHAPHDGRFLLRVEVTGANDASIGPRFFFGLDCVVLEPGS